MNRTKWVFVILLFVLWFTPEYTSPLLAQEGETEEFTLEEITVTAQKREENQQKVPVAMEVISGDELKELGRKDIDYILSNVSSVLPQTAEDGLRVSIRGISNDNSPWLNIQASTPTVAVNTDGVYTNRNTGNRNMFDIERVEVLFGPQSTMYASASPGGIVNIITADPKTDRYEASGSLEYGNYNLLRTEGAMNAPVNDRMAFRAAFTTSVRDGYLSNGSNDEDMKSARLKALFQPGDNLSIVLTGETTKSAGQGFASVKAFDTGDGYYYESRGMGLPLEKDGKVEDPWTSASESAGLGRYDSVKKVSAHVDWDLGYAGTISIIPSYVKTNTSSSGTTQGMAMGGGTPPTISRDRKGNGDEKGFETRMTSSEDFPFKWILGANKYESSDSVRTEEVTQETGDISISDVTSKQDITAVYGNITYPFTDRIRATGGVRHSWDENRTINYQAPCRLQPLPECSSTQVIEYKNPDYKVGFEYDLSDNSMLYCDWSSSYRTQGTGATPTDEPLPPEELIAYTAGAKNRFLGNRLQLNVSAYYYDYKNYFANMGPTMIPRDDDGDGEWDMDTETAIVSAINIRTGDARVYGFDIQTSTIITSKDKLDLSVSYIKKEFTDLFFDFPEIMNSFGIPDIDYSGRDMPQAPNWNVTANYSHNFVLWNGGSLKAGFEFRYTSKTCLNWVAQQLNLNIENLGTRMNPIFTGNYTAEVTDTGPVRWQEAYHLENISLIYADPSGKWTLTGYVNNLRNYAVKRFLDGMGNLHIGDPRTYGAIFSVTF